MCGAGRFINLLQDSCIHGLTVVLHKKAKDNFLATLSDQHCTFRETGLNSHWGIVAIAEIVK